MTVEFQQMFDFIHWIEKNEWSIDYASGWSNEDFIEMYTDRQLYNLYLEGDDKTISK